MKLTISELTVMQMLMQGKTVPKNLEMDRASLRLKINKELEAAVATIEF